MKPHIFEGLGSGYRQGKGIRAAPLQTGATLHRTINPKDYYMFGGSERLNYVLDHVLTIQSELQGFTADAIVSHVVLPARTPSRLAYEFYLRLLEFPRGVPCPAFEQPTGTLRCWAGSALVFHAVPGDVEHEVSPIWSSDRKAFRTSSSRVHSARRAALYHSASSPMARGCFFASFIRPRLPMRFTRSMLAYCLHG